MLMITCDHNNWELGKTLPGMLHSLGGTVKISRDDDEINIRRARTAGGKGRLSRFAMHIGHDPNFCHDYNAPPVSCRRSLQMVFALLDE